MPPGSRNRRKRARQVESPPGKRPKHPKQVESNVHSMNFQWRVDAIDLEGDWGWQRATIEVLFKKIIPKLHQFETMTWGQLEGSSNHHFVGWDRLCRAAQRRLEELRREDISELFSLRMDSRARIWGQRDVARLNLLWWDPDHQVCPSPMRHT